MVKVAQTVDQAVEFLQLIKSQGVAPQMKEEIWPKSKFTAFVNKNSGISFFTIVLIFSSFCEKQLLIHKRNNINNILVFIIL